MSISNQDNPPLLWHAHGQIELDISSLRLSFLMILDWAKVTIKTNQQTDELK